MGANPMFAEVAARKRLETHEAGGVAQKRARLRGAALGRIFESMRCLWTSGGCYNASRSQQKEIQALEEIQRPICPKARPLHCLSTAIENRRPLAKERVRMSLARDKPGRRNSDFAGVMEASPA